MCAVSQIVKYQVMTKLDTVNEMCKILFGFKKTYHCNVMCMPQTVALPFYHVLQAQKRTWYWSSHASSK